MTKLHTRDIPTVEESHFQPNLEQQRWSDCIWHARLFVTAKQTTFDKFLTESNGSFNVLKGDVLEYMHCRITDEVLFRYFKHRSTNVVIKTSCWYIGDYLDGCIRKSQTWESL